MRRGETAPNLYRRVTTKMRVAIELTTGSKYMKNNGKKCLKQAELLYFFCTFFPSIRILFFQYSFHLFLYQRTKNDCPIDSFKNIQVKITSKIMR